MAFPALLAAVLMSQTTNVTGVVTFERDGLPFYFMQDDSGVNWRVSRPESPEAAVGDRITVTGEREQSVKHRISTKALSVIGKAPGGPPPPKEVTLAELFANIMPFGNSEWYGGMFTTEGLLRDINRRQNTTQLLVGEDDNCIQVEMPWALEDSLPSKLVLGARVRVTGALAYTSIENVEEQVFGRIENIELIPISGEDVKVVRRAPKPPYWTTRLVLTVIASCGAVSLFLLVWVVTLRCMVRRRSRELADSIRQRETTRIEADASRRERLRLAADLHDGFQQYLAGAMFRLKAARNYLPKDAEKSREQLDKVHDALQHTQNGLRTTLWAMNEESEGPESLKALFSFVARRMAHWEGIVTIVSEGEERTVARHFCGSLLLIMQEAVGNAIRHGAAKHVEVRVSFREKDIELVINDDGCGFDVGAALETGHYGLSTMERRINELGGEMKIESRPGAGTTVRFSIPA